MRVLMLGGTGTIGTAAITALQRRQHEVIALARSAAAAERLSASETQVVMGNIRAPAEWIGKVDRVDAVVQVAGDFEPDSGAVERALLAEMLPRLAGKSFVYTGGCWLYGPSGEQVITEDSAFSPPTAWAWALDHLKTVQSDTRMRGMVIHPAMVYERDGGVFAQFRRDIDVLGKVRVVAHEGVRWPLVHRRDIGELYALALERGIPGGSYIGASVESIPVGMIARAMARRAGINCAPLIRSEDDIAAELGEWARGYAIDQSMSGAKARRELGWNPLHTDPLADVS